MLEFRPTVIEDAHALSECIGYVARERHFLANTTGFSSAQIREFVQFLTKCGGVHVVAVDGNDVVGWCDITPGAFEGLNHVGHLGMGLLPNYRGKGWGQKLLSYALTSAFSGATERVDLEVFASNDQAIRLYRNAGFREEGRKRNARKLDSKYDDIIVFGLLRKEWKGKKNL